MGSCVSRSSVSTRAAFDGAITAKIVDMDGSMAQFAELVTASEALGATGRGTSHFLCSSDELYFDAPIRALGAHDELQEGQLYFALPLSMLHRPLPGQDMATLAVKASTVLAVDAGIAAASASVSSRRKGGDDGADGKRGNTARVAPLVVVSSNESQSSEGAWNHHGYSAHKTAYDVERTVGKMRHGVGYRRGARRRAGVQRLSAITEGSE